MHVRHIMGDLTEEVVKANGTIVRRKVPPSLKALQSYWDLTVPKPAQRVKLGGRVGIDLSAAFREPTTIDAKSLMKSVDAELPEDTEKEESGSADV